MLSRLEAAVGEASTMLSEVTSKSGGIILVKKEVNVNQDATNATKDEGAGQATAADEHLVYDEFAPFALAQHEGKSLRTFASFSEAVDEFFSKIEVQKAAAAYAAQQNAAWKKVDKIREAQEARVQGLRAKEEEDVSKAGLIEMHSAEVDALLGLLRNGLASSMDWGELQALISDAAKAGDELANMVHSLDLANKSVTLVLTEEEDDADEEALTRPATAVKLDISASALANARSYYTQKKAAASKTIKTVHAAEHAVKQAEKKAATAVAAMQVQKAIRAVRSPFWWEKFDWFVSSENFLVLLAKDAQQVSNPAIFST